MAKVEIHGYAIVSDDDRIADAAGQVPSGLRNDADWTYFQGELDLASLSVLGRLGHAANPNVKRRRRLVLSTSVADLEERSDAWWWNPAAIAWPDVAGALLPSGGRVAVPGGKRVFDLFLGIGYDAFHLARARGVRVPQGVAVFSDCDGGESAEAVLARHGLTPGPVKVIDPSAPVDMSIWRSP